MNHLHEPSHKCGYTAPVPFMPEAPRVAHAYVPFQQNAGIIYSPEKGLKRGTIFEDLDQPYNICKCMVHRS